MSQFRTWLVRAVAYCAFAVGCASSPMNVADPAEPVPCKFPEGSSPEDSSLEASSLEDRDWALVRLGEQSVKHATPMSPAFLRLSSADKRIAASAGCNLFSSTYTLKGGQLRLGQVAGTFIACEHGMEQERALLDALKAIASWRISGEKLELLDGDGRIVATLEPMPG